MIGYTENNYCVTDEEWEAKKKYTDFIAALPEDIRWKIEGLAHDNSFATEVYDEYDDDLERWEVAYETARCYAEGDIEMPY